MKKRILIFIVSFLSLNHRLLAEEEFNDVRRGFYTGVSTGGIYFTEGDKTDFDNGMIVGVKGGYDLNQWFGAELNLFISGHESAPVAQSTPPTFFLFQPMILVRGGYNITRRFNLSGVAGAGLFYSTPNMKPNVGSGTRGVFSGGMEMDYHLKSRGLSIGLQPLLSGVTDLRSVVLQFTGHVRYTF